MLMSKISVAAAVKQVAAQVSVKTGFGGDWGKGCDWGMPDVKPVITPPVFCKPDPVKLVPGKEGLFGGKPVIKPIDPWGDRDDDDCDDRDGGKGKGHGKDDDRGKDKDRDDDRHHGRDRDDDDRDHGRDDDRDHGHGKDHGHGHGKDCRDDDEDDGDNAGSGFPDIPKDTTGVTFHIDLNGDDGADEYYYVQKAPAVTKDMGLADYYSAVKQDLAKDFPDKAPQDIVIKATIYSASEGESYYYFTGDEEEGGKDDDDDKTCGWGDRDWDWDFGKSFGKGGGLGCKIVAKAGNLKDFVNAKFMADLSAGREALDEDAPGHDDDDEDEDDDC